MRVNSPTVSRGSHVGGVLKGLQGSLAVGQGLIGLRTEAVISQHLTISFQEPLRQHLAHPYDRHTLNP